MLNSYLVPVVTLTNVAATTFDVANATSNRWVKMHLRRVTLLITSISGRRSSFSIENSAKFEWCLHFVDVSTGQSSLPASTAWTAFLYVHVRSSYLGLSSISHAWSTTCQARRRTAYCWGHALQSKPVIMCAKNIERCWGQAVRGGMRRGMHMVGLVRWGRNHLRIKENLSDGVGFVRWCRIGLWDEMWEM